MLTKKGNMARWALFFAIQIKRRRQNKSVPEYHSIVRSQHPSRTTSDSSDSFQQAGASYQSSGSEYGGTHQAALPRRAAACGRL
jgi:hypothetical protein